MPLGQKLWEEKTTAVAMRIKDVSERGVWEEISFVGECRGVGGPMQGMEARITATDDFWQNPAGDISNGTACGVMRFRDGEVVRFKAIGLAKTIRHSPVAASNVVSLISFVDPPPNLSWMRSTLVLLEGVTDVTTQTMTATAYEWSA